MIENIISPQSLDMRFFRTAAYDTITESQIVPVIREEFGIRYLRGSSLVIEEPRPDGGYNVCSIERRFRDLLRFKDINHALELGTNNGTGSLLLAHYAYYLTTIDVVPRTEPLSLWAYFGLHNKITYSVALTDEARNEYINSLDFDFAYMDTNVNYETNKRDFECVKRCGRVLIHDITHGHVKRFVDELPEKEVTITHPFAYWEKK